VINLINNKAISANATIAGSFIPLRCEIVNYSSRTFVEIHVPKSATDSIEWAFSNSVTFGERIDPGDTHTFRVGPNVDVLVRSVGGPVSVLIHEGS
jgi:hypothetical protein